MRCGVACCFALTLLGAMSGCRSCDRVESELRARENDVLVLRDELDRCGIYNQTLQQEVHALRGQLGIPPDASPPAAYPVKSIALGRQTGGRSNDTGPGDDTLQVQVEPLDPEGQAIKAPGQLLVLAQEITTEGIKRPLSSWLVPPDQLRQSWRNGLLTTGYVLNLPWKNWPTTEKLRITAQFQLPGGRVFEADRDVMVRLAPTNQRPAIVPSPSPRPVEEAPPTLLPPPRIDPGPDKNKDKPSPADSVPGPFLGAIGTKSDTGVKGVPTSLPPLAEILRPIPLKSTAGDP
jgi:hypothetical protein